MTSTQPMPIAISLARSPTSTLSTTRWSHLTHRTAPTTIPPFVYGVTTTKIYCLPTCPSRLARRANVVFFDEPRQAEKDGFRACRRCKPDRASCFTSTLKRRKNSCSCKSHQLEMAETKLTRHDSISEVTISVSPVNKLGIEDREECEEEHVPTTTRIAHAVQLIQAAASDGKKISLAELSAQVGLSKWHLQRVFKAKVGRSPKRLGEDLVTSETQSRLLAGSDDANGTTLFRNLAQGNADDIAATCISKECCNVERGVVFRDSAQRYILPQTHSSASSPHRYSTIDDFAAGSCATSTRLSTSEPSPFVTAFDLEATDQFQDVAYSKGVPDELNMKNELMFSNHWLDLWSPTSTEDTLLHDLFPEIYI